MRQLSSMTIFATYGSIRRMLVDTLEIDKYDLEKVFSNISVHSQWKLFGHMHGGRYVMYQLESAFSLSESSFHDYIGLWLTAQGFTWQVEFGKNYIEFHLTGYDEV